ncbi:MAG TPA: hypothetical protein VF549_11355 [Solirubrobacteraceae bacterium]
MTFAIPTYRRLAGALALLALVLLAAPAAGRADSIVFLKGGDVWLTSPDGSRQYQVTTGGGWDSPSQADDGTIVAARGQMLVRMDRSGRVLGTPIAALGGDTNTIAGESFKLFGPFDPQVSPDGRQIAYWATAYTTNSSGDVIWNDWRDVTVVTPSDRSKPLTGDDYVTSVRTPSWLTNDRVLVAGSGMTNYNFETWQTGRGSDYLQWWFRYVNAMEYDSELSPDGTKLAGVAMTNGLSSPPDTLHFFSVPGPAWTEGPYPETWLDDAVHPPAGDIRCQSVRDSDVHSPSWSPSSDAVAYDDKDGVWVVDVPSDLGTCSGLTERLLAAGASHPDWGPADVDLAQKPLPPGGAPQDRAAAAGGPAGGATAPAGGPAPAASGPLLAGVSAPRSVRRRAGLVVRVRLTRPARVTVSLCRVVSGRCVGRHARRSVSGKAGTTRIALPTRRLRRGAYRLTVSVAGAATARRGVRLR